MIEAREPALQPESPFSFERLRLPDTEIDVVRLRYENKENPRMSLTADIAPEFGSNVLAFKVGNKDIIWSNKETLQKPTTERVRTDYWTGMPVLWPMPDRYQTADGEVAYDYNDQRVSLEGRNSIKQFVPNLVHGIVDDQQFESDSPRLTEHGIALTNRVRINDNHPMYQYFPYESTLELTYTLMESGLHITYEVFNQGKETLPSVITFHPHFVIPEDSAGNPARDEVRITIPAHHALKYGPSDIPTGKLINTGDNVRYDYRSPRTVEAGEWNATFTDLTGDPEIEFKRYGIKAILKNGKPEDFPDYVYWIAPAEVVGPTFALEPSSGPRNAINLEKAHPELAHVYHVEPGMSVNGAFSISIASLDKSF